MTYPVTPQLVELDGHGRFWFLKDALGSGPLAPLDHCTVTGELIPRNAPLGGSYAHVYADGTIKRLTTVIGSLADLRPVD